MGESRRYEEILRMANDGIVVVDDHVIVMTNPAFAAILQFSEEELIGTRFEDHLDPVTAHLYLEVRDKCVWGTEERPTFRARLLDRQKRVIPVEVSTADFVFQGRPAVVNIVRDMSKQVELEEAANKSEFRFRTLFETSPFAHFMLSKTGTILQTNEAASALLGYEMADIVRRNISSFVFKDEAGKAGPEALEAALRGSVVKDVEMRLQTSAGVPVWVSITSNPLMEGDRITEISLSAINIHRRKVAEELVQRERDRANLYLEVMTHDLQNLNQSITFSLGLLDESADLSDHGRGLVEQTSQTVRRASRMITNLRSLLSLAENPPITQPMDIAHHAHRALKSVQEDFPLREMDVRVASEGVNCIVVGNQYLETALFLVIHNAVMFCEKDIAEVRITLSNKDDGRIVQVEVEDNGPGIPDSMKEQIFKRTGHPDKQIVGRGLGLTLVDAIVRGLRGRVRAEDRVEGHREQGARLVLQLPVWREKKELPCGRSRCIEFYGSDHCIFCAPSMEALTEAIRALGISTDVVIEMNIDDPKLGIKREDVPMLPVIRICDEELVGLVTYDVAFNALTVLAVKSCFTDRDE